MPVNSMSAVELIDHARAKPTLTQLESALLHALEIKVDAIDKLEESLEKLLESLTEE